MVVLAHGETQLRQDAAHVLFDGALSDPKALRYTAVRPALRHEREHLALPARKVGEGIVSPLANQLSDQSGVKNRAATCYTLDGVKEVGGIHHPVLQQVTDPLTTREQVHRRFHLYMSGEQENSGLRRLRSHGSGRIETLRRVRRGHSNIDDDDVWGVIANKILQLLAIASLPNDLMACAAKETRDALPQQNVIIGYDHTGLRHDRLSLRPGRPDRLPRRHGKSRV
jgi:hypothetical protein